MMFRRIDGPLGEFIGFLPRVLWYEVPNHQYKYFEVVLMISMMIFEELRNGGSYIRKIGIKSGKRSKSGQFPEHVPVQVQGCTGTSHQRPTGTGTGPTCTGTGQ